MSSKQTGDRAELAARLYLEMRGFQIIEQNWRRPRCEIDIVARKNSVLHFVEVKYRRDDAQGGGLEAITPTKLKQMQRSAWMYTEENEYNGEYQLDAIEVGGDSFAVLNFLENVY